MLVELSMVEQRYAAVREVLDTDATVTEVATRHGVSRQSLHRWLAAYANGGLGALADRSSRPDRCPHQTSAEIEAQIVSMRRLHPAWGPRTIHTKLARSLDHPPSRSAIYRALVRHGLIQPKGRRRKREDYRRWERTRSMELWQMDVVSRIYLSDGTQLHCVTGIDDHSRFCVIAKLVPRATARPVCDALVEGLNRYGIPDQILTDNGKVFTGKLAKKPAQVLFDRICHNNGIRHILTAPYSPTTTGKVERLHKTMRKEFFNDHVFDTLEATQAALDAWVQTYNTEREHQSLGDVAPIRRFELAKASALAVVDGDVTTEAEVVAPKNWVNRRVDTAGRISILKHRYHVGRYLAGESVVVEQDQGLLTVKHNGVVVATHAKRHLADDDDKAMGRSKAAKAKPPTKGGEVLRNVDGSGSISFAGTAYRVGNKYIGHPAGVRLVGDTVQITVDGTLVRTHQARHDKSKEFGALAQPQGHRKGRGSVA